jgi:hypothetical protein
MNESRPPPSAIEAIRFRRVLQREPGFVLTGRSLQKAAQALNGILDQLDREHNITRKKIARALWGDDVEAKRFYKFCIAPETECSERRLSTMTKKARKYLEIVEAAARLAGTPADPFVAQLFRDTKVEQWAIEVGDYNATPNTSELLSKSDLYLQPEHWYACWVPANANYLECLFSGPAETIETSRHWQISPKSSSRPLLAIERLEALLLDGALETALLTDARRKACVTAMFEVERREATLARRAEAHDRWNQT